VVSFVEVIKQAIHESSLTWGLLAITSRGFNDPTKPLLDCDKRGNIQLFRLPALKRGLNAQKPITQHKVFLHDFRHVHLRLRPARFSRFSYTPTKTSNGGMHQDGNDTNVRLHCSRRQTYQIFPCSLAFRHVP